MSQASKPHVEYVWTVRTVPLLYCRPGAVSLEDDRSADPVQPWADATAGWMHPHILVAELSQDSIRLTVGFKSKQQNRLHGP